jgi:hypothetical protein
VSTAGSTPYLLISHIAAAQTQKEVTANEAFDLLDASVNAQVAFAMADADVTLTQFQTSSGGVLQFTGALTADRYVNIPSVDRAFIVRNSTTGGFHVIVQVVGAGGVSVSVPAGLVALYCDAVDVFPLGGSTVVSAGGGGGGGTAVEYVPAGTIDGSNAIFTLPTGATITYVTGAIPQTTDLHVVVLTGSVTNLYKNGRRMMLGIDFALS